jgi:acetolactate synthase regulatory subunit
MPTTATPISELSLTVDVGPDVSTLQRVLTVLRRRGCVITRVDYAAGDRHRPGYLHVAVAAPARQAGSVGAWVENLVDVQGVSRRPAGKPT